MMKILEDLGNNQYKVEIQPQENNTYRSNAFYIVHDYIRFDSNIWLKNANPNGSTSNVKSFESIQIPIKTFAKIILPRLNEHKYLSEEHFKDRLHDEDDKYYESKGLDKPRYLKGDPYPAYSYQNEVVHFYENGEAKVAVALNGEKSFSIMTLNFFNEFVKDKIKY